MNITLIKRIVAAALCAAALTLCACKSEGGDEVTTGSGAADNGPGLAGIGVKTGAYGGLFDDILEIEITVGEAELSTVIDHADAGVYVEADVTADGQTIDGAGLKARGNTSYVAEAGNERYSFKLKFNKFTKGQKLNGLDELNLNNMSYDPSYVREYLMYLLFAGKSAPLATFAKLTVNGQYYGLYLAVEGIDDSFLKRAFGDNDGSLYEADKGSALVDGDTTTFSLENGEDGRMANITRLYEAISSGEGIEDILDVDSVLRYAAIVGIACGQESYLGPKAENYYLYETSEGVLSMIPWDLKMSFGTDRTLRKTEYQIEAEQIRTDVNAPYFGVEAADRPLVGKLLENSAYKAKYLEYVKQYTTQLKEILGSFKDLKAAIDSAVNSDPRRFYDEALYEAEFTDGENTLYGFIRQRCAFIDSQGE